MSTKDEDRYTYEFCDEDHPSETLSALEEFYKCGLFSDITLQCCTGQTFHCHKALLSARSAYFKVMFTSDMRERSGFIINLPMVDGEILSALVNYVYTSKVSITQTNVQGLLEAADLFQFSSVKKACEEFLLRFLDIDNCLGIHNFAELHICPLLGREALRIILSRFEELIHQDEFLGLDLKKLITILSAENLNVLKEKILLEAVVKWVTFDMNSRRAKIPDLLTCIQLDLDNMYLMTALDAHKCCTEKKLCSVISQSLKLSGKSFSLTNKKLTSNMFIIGGYYWRPLSQVHIWDPISNSWAQGKDMPDYARESYSVTLLGANIYVTGGYRTETVDALDTVWIYNVDSDEWIEGCSMITARYYHCSVTLNGCVYAIGGYSGGAPAHETEFYDPLKKKWFPLAHMIKGVGNATACVVQDKIYVIGGHYGYRGSCIYEKIQTYKADINEWSISTTSPSPEYGLCSVALNNKLYLVGGQSTVTDCYDPEKGEWTKIAMMKESRMECGAVIINGCIYVTGGYSYSKGTYLESIERYDPELDCWEVVGILPSPVRTHGCVSVFSM